MKKTVTQTRTRTTTQTATRTILTTLAIQMICLAAFAGVASAGDLERAEQTCNELKSQVGFYNENIDQVPAFVSLIFGNQRINLYISENGSETVIGVQTDGTKITELSKEPFDEPTMSVYIARSLIDEGLAAKHTDPVSVFTDAWNNGEIKYEAHTYGMKVKMFFAKFLI